MGHMRSKLLLVMCFATGSVVSMISRISLPSDIAKWLPRAVELHLYMWILDYLVSSYDIFQGVATFIHPLWESCGSYKMACEIFTLALEGWKTRPWSIPFHAGRGGGSGECGLSGYFWDFQIFKTDQPRCIPPPGFCDGWLCFVGSLMGIGAACLFVGRWIRLLRSVREGEQGSGTLVEHGPRVRYSTIYKTSCVSFVSQDRGGGSLCLKCKRTEFFVE